MQVYVPARLINKETGTIKEQEVFIGDLPLMTDRGTFVINGAERVIVSTRSFGVQEFITGRRPINKAGGPIAAA